MKVENTTKFIICNADEGDPGAFSDRYLLESQPLRVLTGMMLAGRVIGATTGLIYLRDEYPHASTTLQKAISDLRAAALLGKGINGGEFDFEIKVILGAGAYICGEETALIASIEGRRPEVAVRPPYPTQSGLYGYPTVVNNVETFAATTAILETSGEEYARLGSTRSTGTKLISLSSLFNQPGIVEVEMGTPLDDLLYQWGGGFSQPVKAIQVGGPLGGVIRTDQTTSLTLDFESFAEHGFVLGHGGIVAIPESMPMNRFIHHLFGFVAEESCGKCFPCRLGSIRGEEMFQHALDGSPLNPQLLDDLLLTLEQGSLCGLGGGIPLPIRNILQQFSEELPWTEGRER
jgi:NADH-quinone oxidoreductase subunit F